MQKAATARCVTRIRCEKRDGVVIELCRVHPDGAGHDFKSVGADGRSYAFKVYRVPEVDIIVRGAGPLHVTVPEGG